MVNDKMKKYAQVLNGKAHWIFETEEIPEFAPDITLVEITSVNDVQEGWIYNEETNTFREPTEEDAEEQKLPPTIDKKTEQLQMDNNILLMALTDIYMEIQTLKGGN